MSKMGNLVVFVLFYTQNLMMDLVGWVCFVSKKKKNDAKMQRHTTKVKEKNNFNFLIQTIFSFPPPNQ